MPRYVAANLQCGTRTAVLTWEKRPGVLYYLGSATFTPGVAAVVCNSSADSCSFSGLQCGVQYSLSVRAYTRQCWSDFSAPVNITTGLSFSLSLSWLHSFFLFWHLYLYYIIFCLFSFLSCHIIFKHGLSPSRGFNHLTFVQNPARYRTSPWLVHAPPIHSSWTGPMPLVRSFTPSQSQETWATPAPSRAQCPICIWRFPVARATVSACWGRMISVAASQAPLPSFQPVLSWLPCAYYISPCTIFYSEM